MIRGLMAAAGGLLVIWLLLNLIVAGDLLAFQFWAPKYRDAQREVFEQSQSYVQGKITHITRLRLSYETAEGNQREALRRTILTEAATVDSEDLPEELQAFITGLSAAADTTTTPEGENR